jgi:hypothetical protein
MIAIALLLAASTIAPPDQISVSGASEPLFISAKAATNADGSMNWSLFNEGSRLMLQRTRDCMVIISACHEGRSRRSVVYEGIVATLSPGFELDRPVTLVGIDITAVSAAEPGFPTTGRIYVIHPYAKFDIGDAHFCNVANEESAPFFGDRVTFTADFPPIDVAQTFLAVEPERFVRARR